MKKTFWLLMLVTSITGTVFAQDNNSKSDKVFDLPPGYPSRRFSIDLGKGNKMQIELVNLEDLDRLGNIDSVIRVFLKDIELLKDSLGDESMSRRVDYATDTIGIKKIRVLLSKPKG